MTTTAITTRDGSVAYADLRHYPAERVAHGRCYECDEPASHFLLGHEDKTGRTVGIMLCAGHASGIAIRQGVTRAVPENPALRRRHLSLVRG